MATSPDGRLELEDGDRAAPSSSAAPSIVDSGGAAGPPTSFGTIEHVDVGPLIRGADGLPLPPGMSEAMIGPPPPLPPADPRLFVCLRGPCRYLWEVVAHYDSGNPAETWDPTRGLREGQIRCPDCEGTGDRRVARELAAPGAPACDYQPSQGSNRERRCRLAEDHEGAHFYDEKAAPLPLVAPCLRCRGHKVIADPSSKAIRQPRKIARSCTYQPGVEQDLDDTVMYECNRWDPTVDDTVAERRRVWLAAHPEFQPTE